MAALLVMEVGIIAIEIVVTVMEVVLVMVMIVVMMTVWLHDGGGDHATI